MRSPTIYHVRVHRGWGMIATTASPGQRKLTIAAEKAPPGAMAVVVIRSGRGRRELAAEAWRLEQDARRRWVDTAGWWKCRQQSRNGGIARDCTVMHGLLL